ncbi:probable polygalacturonase At1g80170 [Papaver somniferum]|uniref:probable polygalacturonase At1g80170 n=1 Tax=Papaver somniferum TaxID=3469 RepID=UPI000E6FB58F|nr:probable polygalacturonase At1g80170 [Papaver somniferum]
MIRVTSCTFIKTMNGARIKTWQGGSGYARDIKFEDIYFDSVDNPIVIDQYYCNGVHNCGTQKSAVKVSDVTFKGLRGTSTQEVAINLACSETVRCTNITLENIQAKHVRREKATISYCINANGISHRTVSPPIPCLS